jgi:lysylphosphatidylglycerol synthetase-like protein (DUF2156 family)
VARFFTRRGIIFWQVLFLVLGTSWLWAPHINPALSYRTSLISQYETPSQPFSWVFRTGDVAAALLLAIMAGFFIKRPALKFTGWLLLLISLGIFLDPLITTTCRTVADTCQEYFSASFLLHATETVMTAAVFLMIAIYDSLRRKKLVSILFTVFQLAYGALFVTQLANQDRFNTASQYVYQTILIVWLAWFCRDILVEDYIKTSEFEGRLVRNTLAGWAFINGVVAIVISLAHINLLGHIRGLYFSGDSAWLAQHGIIVGVIMLYLSRHLARGEVRARQIFLLLTGVETIKYSVISPRAGLMLFYFVTFVILFVLRDDFDRGVIPLTWSLRLRDLYFLIGGLLVSAFIALVELDRDNRVSVITSRTADNFTDYIFRGKTLPHTHLNSILLAHSVSVFLSASLLAVLWVLFRPYKTKGGAKDYARVEAMLRKYSISSEDFFKLWPHDKQFFWNPARDGFVAYKIVGSTAFGLADPIADDRAGLIEAFNQWCRSRRLKVCYLPVYETSLKLYQQAGLEVLQIGSSAVIDINKFMEDTSRDKWWRWRGNKAQKAGYEYAYVDPPHSAKFINQLRRISNEWLEVGGHAERGFALGYFDTGYLQQCRIHHLKDAQGRVVAFTNELPQLKNHATMTIDMLRYLPGQDPMAFLLLKTIETAHAANRYKYFDLGFVPFAKASGPLLAIAKAFSSDRFSAKGLEQFKNKFDPSWQPNYMAYEGDMADLAIIALSIENALG